MPDWSTSDFAEILTRYDLSDIFKYGFQAARRSKAEPRFNNDRMCLELSGFEVDIIEEVGYLWDPRYAEYYSLWVWLFSMLFRPPMEAYVVSNWLQVARLWSGENYIGGGDIYPLVHTITYIRHQPHFGRIPLVIRSY